MQVFFALMLDKFYSQHNPCYTEIVLTIKGEKIMPLLEDFEEFQNVSPLLQWAIFIVGVLIAIVAIISIGVSLWLAYKYIRFNRTKNSAGLTGKEVARNLLDKNGLQHIKVSKWGSFIFGNRY